MISINPLTNSYTDPSTDPLVNLSIDLFDRYTKHGPDFPFPEAMDAINMLHSVDQSIGSLRRSPTYLKFHTIVSKILQKLSPECDHTYSVASLTKQLPLIFFVPMIGAISKVIFSKSRLTNIRYVEISTEVSRYYSGNRTVDPTLFVSDPYSLYWSDINQALYGLLNDTTSIIAHHKKISWDSAFKLALDKSAHHSISRDQIIKYYDDHQTFYYKMFDECNDTSRKLTFGDTGRDLLFEILYNTGNIFTPHTLLHYLTDDPTYQLTISGNLSVINQYLRSRHYSGLTTNIDDVVSSIVHLIKCLIRHQYLSPDPIKFNIQINVEHIFSHQYVDFSGRTINVNRTVLSPKKYMNVSGKIISTISFASGWMV
jgi:hypothetical protein